MRLRTVAAIAVAAGAFATGVSSSGVGAARATAPAEAWVGGYAIGSAHVVLHVALSAEGRRLRGTAAVGIAARPVRTALRQARLEDDHVSLTLGNGTLLDGRRSGDRITGTARARNGRGRFELLLLRPSAVDEIRQAVGAYRFADGTVAGLFLDPFEESLRVIDYAGGDMRQLAQISEDAFVGGTRLLAPWPFRSRVELVRDPAGQVVALRRDGRLAARIPLVVEAATFQNGDVRLAGKLLLPQGPGPFPAVVLVHGSIRGTRDSADLWGAFFASQGVAMLSYDKRGVGESTGQYVRSADEANLRALAGDALAGVAWLRQRADIDAARIGLVGGSQAGWTIPLAASESSDVAFAAIQSGPAMPVGRQLAYNALTRDGARVPPPTDAEIHATLDGLPDDGFDPRPAIQALRIPVIWQLGGVDKRMYTPESVANLDAISAGGGHDFTVHVYPAGAHSLRETRHGLLSEELLASRFVPGVFADLAAWLASHVSTSPS
jgi:dienelactone hydrolase